MGDDEPPILLDWQRVPGTGEPEPKRRLSIGFRDTYGFGASLRRFLAEPVAPSALKTWRMIGVVGLIIVGALVIVAFRS